MKTFYYSYIPYTVLLKLPCISSSIYSNSKQNKPTRTDLFLDQKKTDLIPEGKNPRD